MDKLKPCPFCGGRAEIGTFGFGQYAVSCRICRSKTSRFQGDENAIEVWNYRTEEQNLLAELEKTKENFNGYAEDMEVDKSKLLSRIAELEASQDSRPEAEEPLTVDELEKMDGEPIWIIRYYSSFPDLEGWALVNGFDKFNCLKYSAYKVLAGNMPKDTYGIDWVAYRHKPQEEPSV